MFDLGTAAEVAAGVGNFPVVSKAFASAELISCHAKVPPTSTQMYRDDCPGSPVAIQGPRALTAGMPVQVG